jgi:hypothetical protein
MIEAKLPDEADVHRLLGWQDHASIMADLRTALEPDLE